jgi:hypothetical protein
LLARVLATNRPWLESKPVRATYFFNREVSEWSFTRALQTHSLKPLHGREKELVGPLNARWKSRSDLRLGVNFETPLGAMLRDRSNYTVVPLGTTKWRGQRVVGVDVAFQRQVQGGVGMGAGNTHYSSAGFGASSARILIEPRSALPLFIGTSESSMIGGRPQFQSTFTFEPNFFEMPGGRAPRFVEWRMARMSWCSRFEFQVTNAFWMFKQGAASIKMDRWSHLYQRLEMSRLQAEPLRHGDLSQEYPTTLSEGDSSVEHARSWRFQPEDMFRVSRFSFSVGENLRLESGPADLGIGHCADGAVWAVLIPRKSGTLHSGLATQGEAVAHVWLRFHPKQIGRLFPQETISADAAEKLRGEICAIANMKMMSSWSTEGKATIPGPGQMTVDVDTKEGPRRFFAVDTQAGTAQYAAEFEPHALNLSPEAIDVMSEPLPDHRQAVAEQSRDKSRPKVVAVHPAPGTLAVPPETELRVRFDRPMDPLGVGFNWDFGDCLSADYPRYDSNKFEFAINARLAPGVLHQVVVNTEQAGFGEGFVSPGGKRASLYVWRFTTGRAPVAPATAAPPATASVLADNSDGGTSSNALKLLDLLGTMQRRRAQLTSLVENVQQVFQQHGSGIRSLWFMGGTFKWQQAGYYYGDASQFVDGLFRIGCDGRNWWWEIGSVDNPDLVLCPTNAMHLPDISLADPFDLATDSPANAVLKLGLVYGGVTNVAGTDYHLIESRPAGPATAPRVRWWIDPQSYLMAEMESDGVRTRYLYESLNRPLPPSAFAPARPPGARPGRPDVLESGYTNRFVNLRDGSDGRMSVRWGQIGPKGRSSSGLN